MRVATFTVKRHSVEIYRLLKNLPTTENKTLNRENISDTHSEIRSKLLTHSKLKFLNRDKCSDYLQECLKLMLTYEEKMETVNYIRLIDKGIEFGFLISRQFAIIHKQKGN